MTFNRKNFIEFYKAILESYHDNFKKKYDNNDIVDIIFLKETIVETEFFKSMLHNTNDNEIESILSRILGVINIIEARENKSDLDIKQTWKYISESILKISLEHTISSIGSQGFLSIPLYKNDPNLSEFDFIRLHIWDNSLNEKMDLEKCQLFGIHTHTFFAKSWIITGTLINERFDHILNSRQGQHSVFKVKYNDSLNNVNQHTSVAINEHIDVEIIKTSTEIYKSGDTYEIKAGKFHRSNFNNSEGIAATFFSFTGKDGLDRSIVVGPKNIEQSEINRKEMIDPTNLLVKITSQITRNE